MVYLGLAIKNGIKWVDLSMAMWLPAGLAEQQQGIGFREPILAGAEELRPRRGVGRMGHQQRRK